MAFDNSIIYTGPMQRLDELTANLVNSVALQRASYADRPVFGNVGVMFVASDGRDGVGGDPYFYMDIGTGWLELGTLQKDLIGELKDYAGGVVPTGYLLCDGAAVSRTTYSALYTAIGTRWGNGNGFSTFNVPDFRRRVAMGSGGVDDGSGIGVLVGSSGGQETHILTIPELPSHTHTIRDVVTNTRTVGSTSGNFVANNSIESGSVGDGIAHTNTQPSAVVLKLIKV